MKKTMHTHSFINLAKRMRMCILAFVHVHSFSQKLTEFYSPGPKSYKATESLVNRKKVFPK